MAHGAHQLLSVSGRSRYTHADRSASPCCYHRRDQVLDVAPYVALGSTVDEVVMTSWDGTRSIAADALRDLLRGPAITDPDPRGLHLRAARIRGRLDLKLRAGFIADGAGPDGAVRLFGAHRRSA